MGLQTAPGYIANNNDATPGPQTQFQHPVELGRNLNKGLFLQSGVLRYGDFAVTTPGVGLTVNVAAGMAHLLGVESNTQGGYFVWSNASEALAIASPSGSTRYDSIILRVADPQYGTVTGNSRAYWDVVQGAAGAGVPRADSYFNSGGGGYVPGAWFRVADIQVDTGVTSIAANKITSNLRYISPPGGITYCTSTTRPTGYLGQKIYEVDTKFERRYNGSSWEQSAPWRLESIVTGSVAASVSFSGIPSTLRNVRVRWTARTDGVTTASFMSVQINGITSGVYNYVIKYYPSTTSQTVTPGAAQTALILGVMPGASATANVWGSGTFEFEGWDQHLVSANRPQATGRAEFFDSGSNYYDFNASGSAATAGPWTSMLIKPATGNLLVGSKFILEGWE